MYGHVARLRNVSKCNGIQEFEYFMSYKLSLVFLKIMLKSVNQFFELSKAVMNFTRFREYFFLLTRNLTSFSSSERILYENKNLITKLQAKHI